MRIVLYLAALSACAPSGAPRALRPTRSSSHQALRLRITRPVPAQCGDSEFQPAAPADLDGDGAMERVAANRDQDGYALTWHAIPGLNETFRMHVRSDGRVEIAVARATDGVAGDAWAHPGVIEDEAAQRWRFGLVPIARDTAPPTWSYAGSGRIHARVDVDGDGRADVALPDGRFWVGGHLADLGADASRAPTLRGYAAPFGREVPVDLDGDGDLELIADGLDGVRVLAVPSLRPIAQLPSGYSSSAIVRWAGRFYLYSRVENAGRWLELASGAIRSASLPFDGAPRLDLDPAGDGSAIAIARGGDTSIVSTSGTVVATDASLARPGDPATPRLGPTPIDADERTDFAAVRVEPGSPDEPSRYEIVLYDAPSLERERTLYRGTAPDLGGANVSVLDLDGDGRAELLVHESGTYGREVGPDMISISASTWMLLDGEGRVLWRDETRFSEGYDRNDRTADAHVIDLAGDGSLAIRMRTSDAEWYVLPERAPVPDRIPTCLE
jgi:hypothetical protein